MITIIKAGEKDAQLLADIGKISFTDLHSGSLAADALTSYVNRTYNYTAIKEELTDAKNIYHIIYHDNQAAGFSKIIFSSLQQDLPYTNITKLERLYLLKEFHSLKLGFELLKFNIALSRENHEAGMWLIVWKENNRAVDFYKKNGFIITGSCEFKLTETHSNPNYQMFLKY